MNNSIHFEEEHLHLSGKRSQSHSPGSSTSIRRFQGTLMLSFVCRHFCIDLKNNLPSWNVVVFQVKSVTKVGRRREPRCCETKFHLINCLTLGM